MTELVKPFRLGLLRRVLDDAPRKVLCVSTFGFFDFGKPGELELEHQAWPRCLELMPEATGLDQGMPKARGEVLLGGHGMAPRGKPAAALSLSLSIGTVKKRIVARGQRYWRLTTTGHEITAPALLTSCPLDYSAAFGGAGFAMNPTGKGFGAAQLLDRGEVAPLPLLENEGREVSKIDDAPEPVAFGPLGLGWPQRTQYFGTFDAAWATTRWPAYPADARSERFNEAPPDQWIEGFFRGDERFSLDGMNADEPHLVGHLPGVMARSFVRFEGKEQLEELPMRLDTVWLFGSARIGVLIHRGTVPVADSDALDVSHIMVAFEKLADPRRELGYYEDVLARRLDPETGPIAMFADAELGPIVPPPELARRQKEREDLGREKAESFQKMIDAQIDKSIRDAGAKEHLARAQAELSRAAPGKQLPLSAPAAAQPLPMITPGDIERLDFDLAAILRGAEAQRKEAEAGAEKAKAEAETARRQADERLKASGHDLDAEREKRQRARVEQLAGERPPTALGSLMDVELFLAKVEHPAVPAETREAAGKRVLDVQPELDEALREARRRSPEPMDIPEPLLPRIAVYFGELILKGLAGGRSYAGRDLAGAALPGARLSGLNLAGCMLERANLEGADLSGADLGRAVLTGANLRGAKLAGARLREANLSAVDATAADFKGADLEGAQLTKAKLHAALLGDAKLSDALGISAELCDAELPRAQLARAILIEANLERIKAEGADFSDATLLNARLTGASMRRASLARAVLIGVNADDADFEEATLEQALAGHRSSFARASFRAAHAPRAAFRGAMLEAASFERAMLDDADLGDAKLARARIMRASLRRAILAGADLTGAVLTKADLFEALLRKAKLDGAELEGASLYSANAHEASLEDTRFGSANTLRARIRR